MSWYFFSFPVYASVHLLVLFYAKKRHMYIFVSLTMQNKCSTSLVDGFFSVLLRVSISRLAALLVCCENSTDQAYYNCLSANKHTEKDIIFNEFLAFLVLQIIHTEKKRNIRSFEHVFLGRNCEENSYSSVLN